MSGRGRHTRHVELGVCMHIHIDRVLAGERSGRVNLIIDSLMFNFRGKAVLSPNGIGNREEGRRARAGAPKGGRTPIL